MVNKMTLKKGSKEAKAFMAKLRAKRATKSKVKPKPSRIDDLLLLDEIKARQKKVGSYYFGEGKKVNLGDLKPNNIFEWTIGAEYLEVVYIGKVKDFPNIKIGSKMGTNPTYLFQFLKGNDYVALSFFAIKDVLRTIPKKVGSTLKLTPKETRLGATENDFKKQSKSYHKDTKSHNVNIRVVSGINGIIINDIKSKYDILTKWNKVLENLNTELKNETNKGYKAAIKVDIFRVKNIIKDIKKDITSSQRKVK
jgi:hypothetical protein